MPPAPTPARAAAPPRAAAAAARGRRRASRARATMPREAVTRPPAGPGANAAARSSTRPPWAPTPGSRKTARGISVPQTLEPLGRGRADDRADVGEAARADRRPRPSSATSRASRSLTDPPSCERQLLDVGGAGVGGAHEHEQAAAGRARAAASSGRSESSPSSGLTVSASAPSPGTGPNGVGVVAEERLRVGRGGDVDVAALGVGDDQQAALLRARDHLARAPPSPGPRGARSRRAGA